MTQICRTALISSLAIFLVRQDSFAQESLVARWNLDREHIQQKTVRSETGVWNGTVVGPVSFGPEPPHGLVFDGESAGRHWIEIESANHFAKMPRAQITVEAWVRIDEPLEWGGIIGIIQDNGSYEKGWLLGFRNWRFCFALKSSGAAQLTYLTGQRDFAPGVWYHVMGTFDGQVQSLFVDGTLEATSKVQRDAIDYSDRKLLTIGAYRDDNEHHSMTGEIAQVSIWNHAMEGREVAERFGAGKDRFPGIEAAPPAVADWPTYRRDPQRTGHTPEELKFPLQLEWEFRPRHAPKPAWPAPAQQDFWHKKAKLRPRVVYDRAFHLVSGENRLLFGSSADDQLYCLDVATGTVQWSFFTEGPIRLAPTLADGKVLFGSDDGYLYCLRSTDGGMIWKRRLGPDDRRIVGNGRVISVWPIRSGVLVEGDHVFACAGLFPNQGTYHAALDLKTGKILALNQINVSPQGYLERRSGRLHVATGRDPAGAFVARLLRRGKDVGKEVLKIPDDYKFEFIRAGEVQIGGGDGNVAAFRADDGKEIWSAQVDGRAYSLAVAKGRLFVSTDKGQIACFGNSPQKPARIATSGSRPLPEASGDIKSVTRRLVEQSGINKGLCLLVGLGTGLLPIELAAQTDLQVVGVDADPRKVEAIRQLVSSAGLYGRVSIHHLSDLEKLPYSDYLFNLVVSQQIDPEQGLVKELHRVLRPFGGVLVVGLDRMQLHRRGSLDGSGEWTHMYANAANTACSLDKRVTGPMQLQWFGRPGPAAMVDRHHRTIPPLLKNGCLFVPGNDRVMAVDAYNGTPLWSKELPGSRRVGVFRDCGYMVASNDHLYIALKDRCVGFNPLTGDEEKVFQVPKLRGEDFEWGYLGSVDGVVCGSAVRPGASRRGHSRDTIVEGTYWDARPLVCSNSLFALSEKDEKLLWEYRPPGGLIINSTITIGEGRLFFIESRNESTLRLSNGRASPQELLRPGSNLVALDLQTGSLHFRAPIDLTRTEHVVYLSYAQQKLVVVGSYNNGTDKETSQVMFDIVTVNSDTGEILWTKSQGQGTKIGGEHGEQDHHPVIVGDKLYCEPHGYNLHSGAPLTDWGWVKEHRRGCGTISASSSALFFRQANPTMFDLETNQYQKVTSCTRPGCWINIIPAGGLLLIPESSSGCSCNFAVQTSMAFIPEAVE